MKKVKIVIVGNHPSLKLGAVYNVDKRDANRLVQLGLAEIDGTPNDEVPNFKVDKIKVEPNNKKDERIEGNTGSEETGSDKNGIEPTKKTRGRKKKQQ